MTNQNKEKALNLENVNVGLAASRVWYFLRMNTPKFLGSKIGEDPQYFIDKVTKIFGVMQLIGNDRVKLASY